MKKKWKDRFLKLAVDVNGWSKDPSTKVSAVIADKHNYVRAVAYNGFPKDIIDDDRLYDRNVKYELIQHAEANAISTCAKLGIKTRKCTMIVTHFPCPRCAGLIINAGIKRVITQKPNEDFISRWGDGIKITKEMFKEAGIKLHTINYKT